VTGWNFLSIDRQGARAAGIEILAFCPSATSSRHIKSFHDFIDPITTYPKEPFIMKKSGIYFPIAVILACTVLSCGFFGPSDEEVYKAMSSAMDALERVPVMTDEIAEKLQYTNTADVHRENKSGTINQTASFSVDRYQKLLLVEGVCSLNHYVDKRFGYTMDGSIAYNFKVGAGKNNYNDDFQMSVDLKCEGGKVESLKFTIDHKQLMARELPIIWVNGKDHKFKDQFSRNIINKLNTMSGPL
jgi:hypothetical protein